MRCFAIVPAGGRSRRFGRPKLLAEWRGKTLLEHVVASLQGAAERIVVVTHPDLPELIGIVNAAGASAVPLPVPTPDMRATILVGLDWLEANERPTANDAWFLLPGDVPNVATSVAALLRNVALANPAKSIFVPTYQGRRGHPVLLRWSHVPAFRTLPEGNGLSSYVRTQETATQEVPVAEVGILTDVDSPAELERLGNA